MQKKSLETFLYSSAGIVLMLAALLAINVIGGVKPVRVDLTEEKAFTLSAGTQSILQKLDTPVKIRFYCTQSETATPETVYLKNYARKVADLLEEYQQVAGKNLLVEKYDPQPDSDAEDSARLDGLEPEPLPGVERFYLGLAVSLADERVALPFLEPGRERQLEYDLTRAIARVLTPEKPTVGILSGLPVFGEAGNPMMMQMGQPGTPPWTLIEQLRQDFNVQRIEMGTEKIDDAVKVLVVIHPKDISDATQFAIDQFVLRGGKLIAFLDAQSAVASRQQNPMMGGGGGSSSSLDKLLGAWGLQFDTHQVVADLNFKMQLGGRDGQPVDAPAWLALTPDGQTVLIDDPQTSPFLKPPRFASGGGGLTSTTADYLQFVRMLLGRGSLNGKRLIGPKTLELMTVNHIPGGRDLTQASVSLFSEAIYEGVGFGLGFAVTFDAPRTLIPGTSGEYFWGGWASTFFFVDPIEDLAVVFMTQLGPSNSYPNRRQIRTMVYAALTETA